MTLSDADLGRIRDEVGASPDDATLIDYHADLASGSWIPTALRVLRRRRAELAAGGAGVSNISVPGLTLGLAAGNLGSLDRQISRLERELADWEITQAGPCESTASTGRVQRQTYRSG